MLWHCRANFSLANPALFCHGLFFCGRAQPFVARGVIIFTGTQVVYEMLTSMKDLGNFIKRYGASKWMSVLLLLPVILFLAGGVWLLWLRNNTAPENRQFLLVAAIVAIAAGILFLFLRRKKLAHEQFWLYEHGIKVTGGKNPPEDSLLFTEIGQVYRFVSGSQTSAPDNLAFRRDDKDSWKLITPKIAGSGELIKLFLEKHLEQQGREWTAQLEAGKRLYFAYLTETGKWNSSLLANGTRHRPLDLPVKTLSLDKFTLHVEDNTYALNETATVQVNNWSDAVMLTDKSGKKIFSVPYLSLLNADLFIQLVNHLTRKG